MGCRGVENGNPEGVVAPWSEFQKLCLSSASNTMAILRLNRDMEAKPWPLQASVDS
jgi:hypothetical protein